MDLHTVLTDADFTKVEGEKTGTTPSAPSETPSAGAAPAESGADVGLDDGYPLMRQALGLSEK